MKILAIDSSAIAASVAVCEDDRLLGEYTLNNGNTHSQTLLPMVEALFRSLSLTADDVDLFAVSTGPGSFTGVRIGVATLKGLAFGTQKSCVGVSTLEALAYNLNIVTGLVCPVMNARRKQLYTALFRFQNGICERLMPDSALSVEELDHLLSQYPEPVFLVGDGYEIAKEFLTHLVFQTPERLRHQSAFSVAAVARQAFLAGNHATDATIAPIYLRKSQAERERAEREQAERENQHQNETENANR